MATSFTRRTALGIGAGALLGVGLAGCSTGEKGSAGGTTPSAVPTAPTKAVTIEVGNKPGPEKTAALAKLAENVKEFSTKHPKITVKPVETKWKAQTFNAMVAGGTLPAVIQVPFTEPQGLIARHQVADITNVADSLKVLDILNPSTLAVVENKSGHVFGVPVDVYSLGLAYNRDLFKKAGLDPDKPPKTWKELREYARKISQKTSAAGFATLTTKHQGGWMLTAMTYSRGGKMENAAGTKATFDSHATEDALKLLHDMRWKDNSMGSQFLYALGAARRDFAAGKIGMMIDQPIGYTAPISKFGMDPHAYGFGSLPQADPSDSRSLAGGSVAIVSKKASLNERIAAVDWISFHYLTRYTDKSVAVAHAKATRADGGIVGIPQLSPLSKKNYDRYMSWLEPYSNVPAKNFEPYIKATKTQKLVSEPSRQAQELYATLDPVMQAVLTKQDADIETLLKSAVSDVNAKLSR